ncbi:hypothetical protein [Dubosiella newyorkensis]|uniref:Uncharacterized protein n=1 Tax=Dubosiella newyorkensis TaxID=1862672 RepID=A0A1U7NMU7_9FIRM|nr:hypothetical protein [Dubosiella newyorkensis]OLU46616.1 hypothetical protein BO225_05445 [Dubosiella newyorkensis]
MTDYKFMARVNKNIQKHLEEKAMIELQTEALKEHRKIQIITSVIGAALILLTFMLETPH